MFEHTSTKNKVGTLKAQSSDRRLSCNRRSLFIQSKWKMAFHTASGNYTRPIVKLTFIAPAMEEIWILQDRGCRSIVPGTQEGGGVLRQIHRA